MENKQATFFGQPRGLATLFFTEMWERASYYGMRAILLLYMVADMAHNGMGLSAKEAGAVYGLYTASVYLLSLPGGWLADNIFGQRKAVWYGGILILIGHLILALPMPHWVFFVGLSFVAFGTGFLKPNISTMVGDLYPEGGARRDAGFSIFYMGINTGSVLGQLACPVLADSFGWHYGFGFAAIGMFFGLLQYRMTGSFLGDIGIKPKAKEQREEDGEVGAVNKPLVWGLVGIMAFMLALLQWIGKIDLLSASGFAGTFKYVILVIVVFYFIYLFFAGGLNSDERSRILVIFLLFLGAVLFWSGFEQAGSSFTLFTDKYVERNILGWNIPAGLFQVLNAIFLVALAPVFAWVWTLLANRNSNPNVPIKFGLGLIFMAFGFWVMFEAAKVVVATNGGKVGMMWLFVTYLLHTIGELCLSPVGLSTTTKLAPKRYVGQMMGIWFVAAALGNLIAGLFASDFDGQNLSTMPPAFWSVVMFGMGSGVLFLVFSPIIKKWMRGVE
jgi:POT family proton-dependent oligopeptide transporter